MQTIGTFEAKTHFSSLLDKVEKGEQVLITKHGHPIAKLISVKSETRRKKHHAIERLKKFAKSQKLGGLDWKSLRDEGRR